MVGTRSNPNGSDVIQNIEGSGTVSRGEFDTLSSTVDKLAQRFDTFFSIWSESQKKEQENSRNLQDNQETSYSNARKSKLTLAEDDDDSLAGITRLSKIEFPPFDGSNAEEWLFRAEQFFEFDKTKDHHKAKLASVHFVGLAASWHRVLILSSSGRNLCRSWESYKAELINRFCEALDDPVSELRELKETNGIVDYHNKFEMLRYRLDYSEESLLKNYIAGLRLDTQTQVRMFGPKTIMDCFLLGKTYEQGHPTPSKPATGHSYNVKPNQGRGILQYKKEADNTRAIATVEGGRNERVIRDRPFVSHELMAERKAKGLCGYCGEVFTKEHFLAKHAKQRLYLIDMEEEVVEPVVIAEPKMEEVLDIAKISINAIAGVSDDHTIRVQGSCGNIPIYILVDTGATHNFLDDRIASKLKYPLEDPGRLRVEVADGRSLNVAGRIKNFEWTFHHHTFKTNVTVIRLKGCDMVLGCNFLKTLGDITVNLGRLDMSFVVNHKKLLLKGIKPGSVKEVKAIKSKEEEDTYYQLSMIQVFEDDEPEDQMKLYSVKAQIEQPTPRNPNLTRILDQFNSLFQEPVELPPSRDKYDHQIPLMEGSNPVNQRPYRYAVQQKNEIDKLVQEMLNAGTIQTSSSPYASPVVLVKKKDGTWRLCVDYRSLNNMTVKNRYPIPIIEDLMDELGGSTVFSKIDLRSGYHQVRMHPADIYKTAFKTHSGHYEYVVMPFGLTNAPATFQGLMNTVFKTLLRKCVLVFFDDILVYSQSLELHWQHLEEVFKLMKENQLFAKESKCDFAATKIEYLGHFISADGIMTDPGKVQAVQEWPIPKNQKQLRGFLGLAGYYRRFVKGYGGIAKPLTELTKKDAFVWSKNAEGAFIQLKEALCNTPVLALPQFELPFEVETDACGSGIGAVLMQKGHPLAYISRVLKGKQLHLSIYEKELLAVVFAVQKWRHYLLTGHFVIKTDQRSLKYLLEQRLNTPIQQQLMPKLLEFDYEIQYKQGKDNHAADALSRVEGTEVLHLAMTTLQCDLLDKIQAGYMEDAETKLKIEKLQRNEAVKYHTWSQGILRRRNKLVVPKVDTLRKEILEWLHSSSIGGHSGREVTLHRIKGVFYWKGLAKDVQTFIRSCAVCQQSKYDTAASPGLLQPLPIPAANWRDISMDFIEGLPASFGKSVILVVVDRLSKAAHFMALSHPYTALTVAQAFLDNVYKLHGLPDSIVSDRDVAFVNTFWKEFFTLQGVALNFSTPYHPQSDGQTEVVNRCLETYLRCMCSDRPHLWSKWLPLAEYWYNTNYHTSTQTTPYEIVYGQTPPIHLPYLPGESKVDVVAKSLRDRENMNLLLKFHLMRAQHRMVQQANKHRSERSFDIGDFVYVKLQPYRQQSLAHRINQKLSPKYYGPYKVLDKRGKVAYLLELPATTKIHPVFHVSQLKKAIGDARVSNTIPGGVNDVFVKEPELVLERRMVNRQGRADTQVLIKWNNETIEEATWEYLYDLKRRYPDFEP